MAAVAKKVEVAEEKKELEQDAKRDPSPKISQTGAFLTPDTTLNVLPSSVGNMLVAMGEGGLSNLVAGARANIGINSGRYMFEAKIVERTGGKSMARFGFSAEGSLFLGEDSNSICFDNEGFSVQDRKKTKCSQAFGSDVMVAVVLNRDPSSPNCNTVSFFKNGVRASQPQPLPEDWKGKTLYPAVSFKNATVHVNFAAATVDLPFKCKVIQEASQKDAVVTKYDEPADGKYTALFPVSLPDEGTFDWLDSFLEKNPEYTELSDRAFVDWALKSGMNGSKKRACNDKPDVGLGNGMENMKGIKKALMQVAGLQPRNFVIMEVKGNLVKEERLAALGQFKSHSFKTVAEVVVGEPSSNFKRRVQNQIQQAKQEASDKAFKVKKAAEKREWLVRKKGKEAAKVKAKMEKERKKKMEEVKKKAALAMKKREAAKTGAVVEEEKEEEAAVESEEDAEEPEEPEPAEEEPPKAPALTAEEKATRFFKHATPDLMETVFNTNFVKFCLPAGDEGFDSMKYTWNKEKEANAYVQDWVKAKKQTTRVEDISPSAWFKQKVSAWQSALQTYKSKQNDYKGKLAKKAADEKAKIAKKAAAERKAKLEAERKAKLAAEGKEDTEKAPAAVEEEAEEEAEEEEPAVDFDGLDIFGVEDILDIGGKTPLFKEFQFEDFAMMSLRVELHLLATSFGKDSSDPDRSGIHLDHLGFYYQKYFGKSLNAQAFGVQTLAEMVALVNDTIDLNNSVIESLIPGDLETYAVFAKLTEDARRMRIIQVDMGEESAKLKIKQNGDNNHGQNNHGMKRGPENAGGQSKPWKKAWTGGGFGRW